MHYNGHCVPFLCYAQAPLSQILDPHPNWPHLTPRGKPLGTRGLHQDPGCCLECGWHLSSPCGSRDYQHPANAACVPNVALCPETADTTSQPSHLLHRPCWNPGVLGEQDVVHWREERKLSQQSPCNVGSSLTISGDAPEQLNHAGGEDTGVTSSLRETAAVLGAQGLRRAQEGSPLGGL